LLPFSGSRKQGPGNAGLAYFCDQHAVLRPHRNFANEIAKLSSRPCHIAAGKLAEFGDDCSERIHCPRL